MTDDKRTQKAQNQQLTVFSKTKKDEWGRGKQGLPQNIPKSAVDWAMAGATGDATAIVRERGEEGREEGGKRRLANSEEASGLG